MPHAPRILVVGDVMIDLVVRPEGPLAIGSDRRARIEARPGGSAANQAVWLAHFGVATTFVGRVGAADLAAQTAQFAQSGVDARLAADDERETGRLIALIDAVGERSFLTDRGANDGLCEADVPDPLLAGIDLIHLSGYSFVAPSPRGVVRRVIARAGAAPVSVDPASAEFLREIGPDNFLAWTQGAQICLPNADEAAALTGAADGEAQLAALARHYPLVVIKRGAQGCAAAAGARRWRVPAPAVAAVDTTGAGDAFVAAFLAARLGGAGMNDCLARAAAAGAAATAFVGGRPPPGRAP
ncbi:MAG: PfkB family carbohydrate kinase [Roseiarcus sp.]